MRWKMGLAAAAFSLAAVPALAASPMFDQDFGTNVKPAFAGHVELGVGAQTFDESDPFNWSVSNTLFEGAGRVNIPLGGVWNFEAETTAHSSWDSKASTSSSGAYAHLWTMLPMSAFGVFGGMNTGNLNIPIHYSNGLIGPQAFGDTYTAGLEGEAYLNRLTLGGQASVSTTAFPGGGEDYPSWQARGYAAFYFTPNTKIVGDVRYTAFSAARFLPDQTRWDYIGVLEHRFAGTPWSIWASGSYSTFSATESFGLTGHQWSALVGFRLFLDSPGTTLHTHDREVPFKFDNQPLILLRPVA